jgi:hypothetical protein
LLDYTKQAATQAAKQAATQAFYEIVQYIMS